jgi:hypothetical protein
MDTSLNYISLRPENLRAMLLEEAKNWLGTTEQIKNNSGQMVEKFQRSVSLDAGDPWCLAFVFYCIDRIEAQAAVLDMNYPRCKLYRTGHCLTLYRNTAMMQRVSAKDALPGDLVIWSKRGTAQGHVGIVYLNNHNGTFSSIEGNTSDGSGVDRDGDGVFLKNRLVGGYGTMEILGFLRVW